VKVVKQRKDGVVQRYSNSRKNDWEVVAAWGDWHPRINRGNHGLLVAKGGRLPNGMYPKEMKYVIVPADKFKKNGAYHNAWLTDSEVEKYESEDFTRGDE